MTANLRSQIATSSWLAKIFKVTICDLKRGKNLISQFAMSKTNCEPIAKCDRSERLEIPSWDFKFGDNRSQFVTASETSNTIRSQFATGSEGNAMSNQTPSHVDNIGSLIRTIRGQKVILDSDLAVIYGVPTKRLNEQVKRNAVRFPPDFLFQLTLKEVADLKTGRNLRPVRKNTATHVFCPTPLPKTARSWRRMCSTVRRRCG